MEDTNRILIRMLKIFTIVSASVLLHLVPLATTEHMANADQHEQDLRGVKTQGASPVKPWTEKFKRQVRLSIN